MFNHTVPKGSSFIFNFSEIYFGNRSIYGAPPSPGYYLNYCMTNCDWSTVRYQTKTKEQMKVALDKLLHSPKWKRPLNKDELAEITKQIE
jgi:hypothetical protein